MNKPTPHRPDTGSPITGGKRTVFAGMAVLLSLLVIVGIELILRVLGWGGYPPILRELGTEGESTVIVTDPDGSRPYFFANPDHPGSNVEYAFRMPKPPNTMRVFLFGGSAIRGYPQPRTLTPSAFLQAMLTDVMPGTDIEVINFGTTAVASFPVFDIFEQAMPYDPDLVVIYAGHNEFFGSYGMASSNRAGGPPWMFRLQHRVRALGIVQALHSLVRRSRPANNSRLMEDMVGVKSIGPNSALRDAAARNLSYHVGEMIRRCDEADIPVLVCTLPSNERDMSPIGEDGIEGMDAGEAAGIGNQLNALAADWTERPDEAEGELQDLITACPSLARAHFFLGKIYYERGDFDRAIRQFVIARDLDTMPWRATSLSQNALRAAAESKGALLCDVEAVFREHSPGGAIGWDLMSDHVHPSLRGQALLAEAVVRCLAALSEGMRPAVADLARLRTWSDYADELGDNPYDRYAVARQLRDLFSIDFLGRNNAEAVQRVTEYTTAFEAGQPKEIRTVVEGWKGNEPITLAVARELIRTERFDEALPLLRIAPDMVPMYSVPHMDYVYAHLRCALQVQGDLSAEDRAEARAEIARGTFLLQTGVAEPWNAQRIVGWLLRLLEDHAAAIPFLTAAQPHLKGMNRVANDRALIDAYLATGEREKAREIVRHGLQYGGQYASGYKDLVDLVEARE